ncbi:MAG: hypothetical protein ACREFZ_01685, partial [Acetobacteraceae bacterium]
RAARLRAAGKKNARCYFASFLEREVSVLAEASGRGRTEEYVPASIAPDTQPGTLVRGQVYAAGEDGLEVVAA